MSFVTLPQLLDLVSDALSLVPAAAALWIAIRVLRYPDLSIEYALTFTAFAFITAGRMHGNWWSGFAVSVITGGFLYLIVGLLQQYVLIPGILVALVASYALYSLSLLLLGSPNASVDAALLAATPSATSDRLARAVSRIVAPAAASIALTGFNCWFLGTVCGQSIVAVGANARAAERLGIQARSRAVLGMVWAGTLIGVSGFLSSQSGGYVDIGMSTGLLAVFLVSITLSRAATNALAVRHPRMMRLQSEMVLLGLAVIATRLLVGLALKLATNPAAVRLIIALQLLIIAVALRKHVTELLRGLRL